MSNQNLRRDEAATRSALITTHSYDVSLDVRQAADPDVAGYTSRSVINFSAGEPGSSTFLDFISSQVHSVFLNGKGLPVADVVDGSRIRLDNLQAENQVTVTGTALYSTSGEGMHRFFDPADGQCYLYTQYEPADARRVFANFEQPDLKAEFTFHVMAPSAWQVSSNGVETLRTQLTSDPDTSRWDFAPTKAMSTYITTVLAGPYFKAEDSWRGTLTDGSVLDVPLALYCRASMAPSFDPEALFTLTKNGLDFFNELFDFPYPWGKYDQAFVPEYNLGAMENPGLVTFTENYVFTSRAADSQYQARANTLLHEMAHMWFGDLVTMQWWDDLWLKESFADYMGTLGVDRTTDWDTAWVNFANNRKAWAYVQDQLPTTHPIVADIPDLEAAKQNFDGITYAKGASVLKQLVAYVGFEAFVAGSRRYFKDHAYGNTTLADLLAALSAASGRDLADWARQWLQTSGISTLTAGIEEHDGVLRAVTLHQDAEDPTTGRQEPRPHRLRIGLYEMDDAGALVRTDSVETDVTGARTDVPALAGKPRPALLLVNDDDLSYAKVRLDPRSEATVRSSLSSLTDPMARALCWTALWDSARDAVTPSALYVDAVQRFGPAETGIGVLLNVLGNASTAIERYVPEVRAGRCPPRFPVRGGRRAPACRAGVRPAAGMGAHGCRDQPVRRQPAGPAPRDPGRQHRHRRACPWMRNSAGTSGTPSPPTGRRPRSSSTGSWPGTTPPPASPGTPPPSQPARMRRSRRQPGLRRCMAPRCPTSCSARPSPASTPAPQRCCRASPTGTSNAWRTCGPGAASRSPAGLSAGSTRPGRTSTAVPRTRTR